MDSLPEDYFVASSQFTPTVHRDVYPAINPVTNPALSQKGKVIAITGATRGIGRHGFVKSFAQAGPKGIVLIGRSADDLRATAEEVKAISPKIEVFEGKADLLDDEAVTALWSEVKNKFGHVDVLVNNAGTLTVRMYPLDDPC